MYIVSSNQVPLLGRTWIRRLKINLTEIDTISKLDQGKHMELFSISKLMDKNSGIFGEKVGCIPDIVCSLKLQNQFLHELCIQNLLP